MVQEGHDTRIHGKPIEAQLIKPCFSFHVQFNYEVQLPWSYQSTFYLKRNYLQVYLL